MRHDSASRQLPDIIVSNTDHERLTGLATGALARMPEVAEELLAEMDRATIAGDDSIPKTVIRMGSTVEFKSGIDDHKRITLVYPGEADIENGKVSVLTPLGAALIGLSAGQSVTWSARDGRRLELAILRVQPPDAATH